MSRKQAAQEDQPMKMLSRRVLALISRDQSMKTPRVVWQHELPILEGVFGEGNVIVLDPETMDEGYSPRMARELLIYNKSQDQVLPPSETSGVGHVFIGSPAVEYERLASAYGMHPEVRQSWCENVYGRFQEGRFTAVVGHPTLDDLPESQLRQLVRDFGADQEQVMKASGDALRKLAAEVGVEIA
jgi:hypothetical protein